MSPARRTPEATDQLRISLIDHARRIVARHGASALTMRSLAAAAGCAVGLPYKVFTDRHELILDILHVEFERLRGGADELIERAGRGRLGGNLAWFAEFFLDSPAVALADEVVADPELAQIFAARFHHSHAGPAVVERGFASYLATEQAAGRVRADVDVAAFGFLIGGAIHNLVMSGAAYPQPSRRTLRRWLTAAASAIATDQ
jgi:AcrR family transcriptional regulator